MTNAELASPSPLPPPPPPIPDPTTLTTNALHREVKHIHKLSKLQVLSAKEILETRLRGMDKALELLQSRADKVPSDTDLAVLRLQQLQDEKFNSIKIQFLERDTRTEQTSRDSKAAVGTALQAAKEAVGEQNKSSALAIAKSEASTTKQIDGIGALITSNSQGFNDKIDDIKARLTMIESHKKGSNDMAGYIFGGVGLLIGISGLIVAIITFLVHNSK